MVAIQGKLEEAGLPDVLQLLALGKKTGCLSLTDQMLQGQIYLNVGRITFAAVANRRDRLGDMLVRGGRITQEQLSQAMERQTADQTKNLGQILVESGQVARAELERFAHVQIEEAVYFLFTWRRGTFTFESGVQPSQQDFLVSINPEGLLLEGARRVDEWSLIQKKIPSFDMVFRLDKARLADSDVSLTTEQRRLLPLLDGTHDVNALVEESAMAEFDVGKALYGLVSAGFALLLDRRSSIRHLDYRELLAYLVHEAEFADPEKRKEATRHIVDCQLCAPRLKEIHVRRTRETGAVKADALAAAEAAAPAGEAAMVPTAPPAPPSATLRPAPKRRSGDRGGPRDASGAPDRRHAQRRQGDRRRAAGTVPPAGLSERRGNDRRQAHRRLKDRLGAALSRSAVRSPAGQGASRSRRDTGPRRLRAVGQDRTAAAPAPKPDAAKPPPPPAPVSVTPPSLAAAATLNQPALPPAATASPSSEPPALAKPGRPGDRSKSKEIQWLVTPEESGFHPVVKPPPAPAKPAPAPSRLSAPTTAIPVASPAPVATPAPQARAAPQPIPTPQAAPVPAAPAPIAHLPPAVRAWLPIAAMIVATASLAVAITLMLQPRASSVGAARPDLLAAAPATVT
ncbi:MAG TPA: DUF4388 domain-containing protein, partial [Gemmatimonadales bacterium]|nr:DUF4388 domain-containing protein [Gemmatimonadales bacterium]